MSDVRALKPPLAPATLPPRPPAPPPPATSSEVEQPFSLDNFLCSFTTSLPDPAALSTGATRGQPGTLFHEDAIAQPCLSMESGGEGFLDFFLAAQHPPQTISADNLSPYGSFTRDGAAVSTVEGAAFAAFNAPNDVKDDGNGQLNYDFASFFMQGDQMPEAATLVDSNPHSPLEVEEGNKSLEKHYSATTHPGHNIASADHYGGSDERGTETEVGEPVELPVPEGKPAVTASNGTRPSKAIPRALPSMTSPRPENAVESGGVCKAAVQDGHPTNRLLSEAVPLPCGASTSPPTSASAETASAEHQFSLAAALAATSHSSGLHTCEDAPRPQAARPQEEEFGDTIVEGDDAEMLEPAAHPQKTQVAHRSAHVEGLADTLGMETKMDCAEEDSAFALRKDRRFFPTPALASASLTSPRGEGASLPLMRGGSGTPTGPPPIASSHSGAPEGTERPLGDKARALLSSLLQETQRVCAHAADIEAARFSEHGLRSQRLAFPAGAVDHGDAPSPPPGSGDDSERSGTLSTSDAVFFADVSQLQQQAARLTEESAASVAMLQVLTGDLLRMLGPHPALSSVAGESFTTTPVALLPSALISVLDELLREENGDAEVEDSSDEVESDGVVSTSPFFFGASTAPQSGDKAGCTAISTEVTALQSVCART